MAPAIDGTARLGQVVVTFDAPERGTLDLGLTAAGRARSASASKTTTLARGHYVYARSRQATFKVKLTRQGLKLLRRTRRLTASQGQLHAAARPTDLDPGVVRLRR